MLPPTFVSFDGTPIRCWPPAPSPVQPVAKILLVHGLGTHGDSLHFRYLREHLTGKGFAVYAFDLRGHGQSGGCRSFVNKWRDFRDDLQLFVRAVERDGASVPLFLLGVSLGGLIAVNYAVHHPEGIQGLIAVAAALDTSGVPAWRRMLLPALSKICPHWSRPTGFADTKLSRDLEAQREFNSDPLRQREITVRLALEIGTAIAETLKMLPLLKLPLLVLHGSADEIIPPAGGRRLHQLAGSADKELHLYEGAYHILTMEINREQVFEDISAWIVKRLGPAPGSPAV